MFLWIWNLIFVLYFGDSGIIIGYLFIFDLLLIDLIFMLGKFFVVLINFFLFLFGSKSSKIFGIINLGIFFLGINWFIIMLMSLIMFLWLSLLVFVLDELQDVFELQFDMVIIVVYEMEEVILFFGEFDKDFDEDIFIDNLEGNVFVELVFVFELIILELEFIFELEFVFFILSGW